MQASNSPMHVDFQYTVFIPRWKMYPVVLVVFVLFHGCRACVLTGHPEDTVAEVGENATLLCSTDFTNCVNNWCVFYWERETNKGFEAISCCDSVCSGYPDRYLLSFGHDWSLTIKGVQPSDARRYRCSIYSYRTDTLDISPPATLIIPSLIDISVQPPRRPITTEDNAKFHCNVQSRLGALPTHNVKWFEWNRRQKISRSIIL